MQILFWDMSPLSQLSKMPIAVKSSENEQPKDGFQACKCGRGTSSCSIHPSTRAKWIASQRVFLAKTLARQEKALGSTGRKAGSFSRSSGSLAKYDRDTFSWKTWQLSLLKDLDEFSGRWSKSGTIVGGRYFPQRRRALPISGKGGGVLLPTPAARDYRSGKGRKENGHTPQLPEVVGGMLNPVFVEWMQGFPINATELKGSGTRKFPHKPPSHG